METKKKENNTKITGHATNNGTLNFVKKNSNAAKHHFKEFNNLFLSSLGMGTYLGDMDDATDLHVKEAVKGSILSGINVIDTAINYRAQKAERSVGMAIAELINEDKIKRDELFISTKNGYITNDGDIKMEFNEYVKTELIEPGIIKHSDISSGCHCMKVPYLEDQLNKALRTWE